MSHPPIIWTMRRSGSTTLATLVADFSDFPRIEHEPFNPGRALHPIVERFVASRDEDRLHAEIREALAGRPVLKHCFDILPVPLNRVLFEVTCALGYRHILLERRDEAARLLSLALARQTNAWGKAEARKIHAAIFAGDRVLEPIPEEALLDECRNAGQRRRMLAELFREAGVRPFPLVFEELFDAPEDGRRRLAALMDWLEQERDAEAFAARSTESLTTTGQDTRSIVSYVPNIDALIAALRQAQPEISPFDGLVVGGPRSARDGVGGVGGVAD